MIEHLDAIWKLEWTEQDKVLLKVFVKAFYGRTTAVLGFTPDVSTLSEAQLDQLINQQGLLRLTGSWLPKDAKAIAERELARRQGKVGWR